LKISEEIELQLLSKSHKDELFGLVDSNRAYLREWLPWIDVNTSSNDTESFISSAIQQYRSGKGPQYAVFSDSTMCGVCGYHSVETDNRVGGIGYWLSEDHSGRKVSCESVSICTASM
jgi:ribosomal-protein-serine acetyltransferase